MTLNNFEQSLLTELRAEVSERAASARTAAGHGSRRRRWTALPVGVAMAIAGTMALSQPPPAYAVDESGGVVEVTIDRLDDAQGLEGALADHGVKADVDYAANAASSGDPASDSPKGSGSPVTTRSLPSAGGSSMSISFADDEFRLEIDRDSLPRGETLVITTSNGSISGLVAWLTPVD